MIGFRRLSQINAWENITKESRLMKAEIWTKLRDDGTRRIKGLRELKLNRELPRRVVGNSWGGEKQAERCLCPVFNPQNYDILLYVANGLMWLWILRGRRWSLII